MTRAGEIDAAKLPNEMQGKWRYPSLYLRSEEHITEESISSTRRKRSL
jgi:hypothetical protein